MSNKRGGKGDLRVRRTRKLLREALVSLVEEKGYDSVSVAEIAERAMVNRATFYLHYEEKYDLLLDVLGETFGAISLGRNPLPGSLEEAPEALVRVLERIGSSPGFYRGVLGDGGSARIRADARVYLEGIVRRWLRAVAGEGWEARVAPEFVAGHAAAAALGTISWWLENGTPYPAERVAAWLVELLSPGIHHALGLAAPALGTDPHAH